ncbi:MAG: hypothetical protein M3O55_07465 [Actinomycetota bacterium]|nr:hypothetical protein [Actinomycetota bacterium]
MGARLTLRTATVALGVGVLAICLPWPSAEAAPHPSPALLSVPQLSSPLLSVPLLTVPLPLPSLDPILRAALLPVTLPAVDPLLKSLLDLDPILGPLAPPSLPGGRAPVPVPVVVPPPVVAVPGAQPAAAAKAAATAPTAAKGPAVASQSITRPAGSATVPNVASVTRPSAPGWRALFASGSAAAPGLVIPVLLIVVLAGFLGAQRLIDRRDPKLAQSPAWPEPDLRFG